MLKACHFVFKLVKMFVCLYIFHQHKNIKYVIKIRQTSIHKGKTKTKYVVRRNVLDDDGALCTVAWRIACWPQREITVRAQPKQTCKKSR